MATAPGGQAVLGEGGSGGREKELGSKAHVQPGTRAFPWSPYLT